MRDITEAISRELGLLALNISSYNHQNESLKNVKNNIITKISSFTN